MINKAEPNNGMHPTADTTALIILDGAARRVMPALDCCCAIALFILNARARRVAQAHV